jgi:hypothetical protein
LIPNNILERRFTFVEVLTHTTLLAVVKRETGFVPPIIEALIGMKTNNGITNEVDILEDRRAVDACETKWSVPWFECDESLT